MLLAAVHSVLAQDLSMYAHCSHSQDEHGTQQVQAHAFASSLQITLSGDLNMGVVLHESLTQRALHLTNEAPQPATFRLETDGALPVRISPAEGQLGARGSPDSSLQVSPAEALALDCSHSRDPAGAA